VWRGRIFALSAKINGRCTAALYLGVDARNRVALTAVASIEFGLRKQGVYFRLAAGEEQHELVERTGERRAFDEVGAALTEPAGQLQQWIVICAHESEAVAGRAFRGIEGND